MKIIKKISFLALISILSPISYASDTYVVSANGSLIKNGYGECWVSSGVKVANKDCGDLPPPPPPAKKFQPIRQEVFHKIEVNTEKVKDVDSFKIVNEVLYFDDNSSEISDDSEQKLLSNILALKPFIYKIEIMGHADARGKSSHNQTLSLQRAESVADFIKNKGVSQNKVHVFSFGNSIPSSECAKNKKSCLDKNRRVEIILTLSNEIQKQ